MTRTAFSFDLRQRLVDDYNAAAGTPAELAEHDQVILGFVEKLLRQRRRTGSIASYHTVVDSHTPLQARTVADCGQL